MRAIRFLLACDESLKVEDKAVETELRRSLKGGLDPGLDHTGGRETHGGVGGAAV